MPLLILSPRQSFKNKRTFAEISFGIEHRFPTPILTGEPRRDWPSLCHATIAFRRLCSSGFLDEGTPAIAPRQTHARRLARLSGQYFQTTGLSAHPRRRGGRSCASARAVWPDDHAGGVGEGIEAGFKHLVERARARLHGL